MLLEVWREEAYTNGFYQPRAGDVIVDAGANHRPLQPPCRAHEPRLPGPGVRTVRRELRAARAQPQFGWRLGPVLLDGSVRSDRNRADAGWRDAFTRSSAPGVRERRDQARTHEDPLARGRHRSPRNVAADYRAARTNAHARRGGGPGHYGMLYATRRG